MIKGPRVSRVLGAVKIVVLRLHEALETFCDVAVLSINWTFTVHVLLSWLPGETTQQALVEDTQFTKSTSAAIEDILLLQSTYSRPSPLWQWNWLH